MLIGLADSHTQCSLEIHFLVDCSKSSVSSSWIMYEGTVVCLSARLGAVLVLLNFLRHCVFVCLFVDVVADAAAVASGCGGGGGGGVSSVVVLQVINHHHPTLLQ